MNTRIDRVRDSGGGGRARALCLSVALLAGGALPLHAQGHRIIGDRVIVDQARALAGLDLADPSGPRRGRWLGAGS